MTRITSVRAPCLRPHPLGALVLSLFAGSASWSVPAAAADAGSAAVGPAEVQFNVQFLRQPEGGHVDVSRFDKGNAALPGRYSADLYVNQSWLGRTEVLLQASDAAGGRVQPCFDRGLLERMNVDLDTLSPETTARLAGGGCLPLPEIVQAATASFDYGELRLDVSLPQASLSRHARGYVDPRYWDDGVTAARLQYNANAYRASSHGLTTTQAYAGLNAGFNVGPWRLHHVGNLTHDSRTGTHYQGVQTSLQRGVASIKSQLTLGEAFTDGSIFDSVGFRGAQLASDDRMYPESQRGYAPTVHGIASSNARVQILQNGNTIYETTVAPGAFVIDDLYPTGYGGDLEVVVTEADGSVHVSKVPYAAAVNALRQGITRYSVTAGQYRSTSIRGTPAMAQATLQHGFTNRLTGYGGVVAAQGYQAVALGAALNTGFGAFGLDVTQARTQLRNQADRNGYSFRLAYSKLVEPTGTNLTLAAYRYSSRGYLDLAGAVALRELERGRLPGSIAGIQRSRLQLTVNQSLPPGYGSFYLSGSTQNYWDRRGVDTQFQLGYNNNTRRVTYGLSATRQFMVDLGRWDTRVMLNIGIPLGGGRHAPYAMTSLQHDGYGNSVQQSVTGSLGVDNAFSYGLNASRRSGAGGSDALGANAAYLSPVAAFSASAARSGAYRQVGAGASGGIVAYAGGVAFTPSMGDTLAVVEAKDAAGARVSNGSGLRIDPWGHAVVGSLTPFASNAIEIDPKGLPLSVEFKSTEQHVAPTAGAVVRMRFLTTDPGRAAILQARTAAGLPLPFGAEVFDAKGRSVGTVAQAGRVIARGLTLDASVLTVRWGGGAGQQCRLPYRLPAVEQGSARPYFATGMVCQ